MTTGGHGDAGDAVNPRGNLKHGGHGTLTYARWRSMLQRCNNPNATNYRYYGAVGIRVHARWHEFANFLADMGECPTPAMTLDRINNDLGYEPGNCRWATKAEQNKNRPAHRVDLTYNGVTKSVAAWSVETGITANLISMRLRLGWNVERTLTTPVNRRR